MLCAFKSQTAAGPRLGTVKDSALQGRNAVLTTGRSNCFRGCRFYLMSVSICRAALKSSPNWAAASTSTAWFAGIPDGQLSSWVLARALQNRALHNPLSLIEPEETGCDFALRRERFDDSTPDPKVIHPSVKPWMK